MQYNKAKMIYGAAELTRNWPLYRENLFRYACDNNDDRWQNDEFRNYVYNEYINVETPITLRAFNLDERNLKLLEEFIKSTF